MKIAIHHTKNSFSDHWIQYCEINKIQYGIVNCYDSDIIQQLEEYDTLLWHFNDSNYKDALFAKQLLFSLEQAGKKVYPDSNSCWHFDDKLGQKYLLESIGAPFVNTHVFYDKKTALNWVETADFPKVFKLRGGVSGANVSLAKTKGEAKKKIKKAFGKGFSQFNGIGHFKDRLQRFKSGKDSWTNLLKAFGRIFIHPEYAKMHPREKGYVYFQDFIPDNSFDIRVIVVGNKAAAERRMVRKNDFRASGSGEFDYKNIDIKVIKTAFKVAKDLKTQSIAFDFVINEQNEPVLIEMSYGFGTKGISQAPGYWDDEFNWHQAEVRPADWIIDDLIKDLNKTESSLNEG